MINRFGILFFPFLAALLCAFSPKATFGDAREGEGVDSQLLWTAPGPSNFPSVQSSDIVPHANVTFGASMGYHRKPLGIERTATGETEWVVENAWGAEFLWAFGILDYLQLGLALPLVFDQDGVGATPFLPEGEEEADYVLASSALRDTRAYVKARFLGGFAELPDRRQWGLAMDVAVTLPSGDELNFAGENGPVLAPTAIVDYHLCMFSAALNLGARLRFADKAELADLDVGHQGVASLAVTGHFLDRRLLLTAEGMAFSALDDFQRFAMEYHGAVGYIPDSEGAVKIWVAAGSSLGTGDVLGTPAIRAFLGFTYSPGGLSADENAAGEYFGAS